MSGKKPSSILLVDDDPLIRQLGRELLENLGYRVETAGEAAEALEVFQKQGANLVILDYLLPGLNGYELFQELRSVHAGVRVLLATGFLSNQETARFRAEGVQGIIHKPFHLKELQKQIEAALAGSPAV